MARFTDVVRVGVVGLALAAGSVSRAQEVVATTPSPAPPPSTPAPIEDATTINIIIPQHHGGRVLTRRPIARPVTISSVDAKVEINDQVATTSLAITLSNPGSMVQEAEIIVPVIDGAAIRGFGLDGLGGEPTAKLLPKEEARRIYEEIVRSMRDPGLLEFAGYNLIRSSVFPVPPGGTQVVRVTYEHLLPKDGQRVDFFLPRSASLEESAVKWTMTARVRSKSAISTVYSPSHGVNVRRDGPNDLFVEATEQATKEPGAWRLSFLGEAGAGEAGGVTTSFFAYPDPSVGQGKGGYFLMLTGLPATIAHEEGAGQKREVMIVIDRSGSMRNEKIEQARSAAVQVLEGLKEGEAFNIVDYSDTVARFSEKPVIKSAKTMADARTYVNGLKAEGGTNIHDALVEAMRQPVTEGMLPMTLFLTDGLPTVGNTAEGVIRDAAKRANTSKRRIFTFGVGLDVNAPLLDRIAQESRAASINVLPSENIEVAVSKVFKRLTGPVMSEPVLAVLDAAGRPTTRAVRNVLPAVLPDLFDGDQLVLLGQYTDESALKFRLNGAYLGKERSFEFDFTPAGSSTVHSFVPRLWATRRIADLNDAIRQNDESAAGPAAKKELIDEIVQLSTRFGILTEYTAFLATEPTPGTTLGFAPALELRDQAETVLSERVALRSGADGVSQSMNTKMAQAAAAPQTINCWTDGNMQTVYVRNVRSVGAEAQFNRAGRWIDQKLMAADGGADKEPERTIEFCSDEYFALAERFAKEGRQSLLAVDGDVYIELDGKRTLVKGPKDPC